MKLRAYDSISAAHTWRAQWFSRFLRDQCSLSMPLHIEPTRSSVGKGNIADGTIPEASEGLHCGDGNTPEAAGRARVVNIPEAAGRLRFACGNTLETVGPLEAGRFDERLGIGTSQLRSMVAPV